MKLTPSFGAAVAATLLCVQFTFADGVDRRNATVTAVANTKNSIVTIKMVKANGTKDVVGTGVIVDERGLIVTNKHVVGKGLNILVCLADKTELAGDVLMSEGRFDLAVVRVKAGKSLPALRLAPTQDLMVGEDVIAIGHPYGYVNTVSRGIISAVDREITLPTGDVLNGLIQTDASINPGNSGGPLLNINGELIGINVALREGAHGIAFAINSGTVEKVLSKHFSAFKVSGVFHGLKTEEKVIAQSGDRQRLEVLETAGSLRIGDQIVTVANKSITNAFDLERALWGKKPGENVDVTVVRQGLEVVATLTLAAGQGAGTVAQVSPSNAAPTQPATQGSVTPANNR
ncbi:MAG: trypsin-like peptidase domain-containing protein [Planctomycetota bacterium]|jgi:serine protease Do